MDIDELTDCFAYLDVLRESGETNMVAAAPYLQAACGLDRDTSRKVLRKWVNTFDGETPAKDRAKIAA